MDIKELKLLNDNFCAAIKKAVAADAPLYVLNDWRLVRRSTCDIAYPDGYGLIVGKDRCKFEDIFTDKAEALALLKVRMEPIIARAQSLPELEEVIAECKKWGIVDSYAEGKYAALKSQMTKYVVTHVIGAGTRRLNDMHITIDVVHAVRLVDAVFRQYDDGIRKRFEVAHAGCYDFKKIGDWLYRNHQDRVTCYSVDSGKCYSY